MSRIIHLGTGQPKFYETSKNLGDPLQISLNQPLYKTYVNILVSDGSSLTQAVSECKRIWNIHAHEDIPLYIGYNLAALLLANVLQSEYGGLVILSEVKI
jgi:hypothetical protein